MSGWSTLIVDAYDYVEGGFGLTVLARPLWGMGT